MIETGPIETQQCSPENFKHWLSRSSTSISNNSMISNTSNTSSPTKTWLWKEDNNEENEQEDEETDSSTSTSPTASQPSPLQTNNFEPNSAFISTTSPISTASTDTHAITKKVGRQLLTGIQAVEKNVAQMAQFIVEYPMTTSVSETLTTDSKKDLSYGVNVLQCSTRAGSGSILAGLQASHAHVAVLLNRYTLDQLSEAELCGQMVLHVHDRVPLLKSLTWSVPKWSNVNCMTIWSSTAQEAGDMAIVAHAVVQHTKAPIVHLIRGQGMYTVQSTVHTLDDDIYVPGNIENSLKMTVTASASEEVHAVWNSMSHALVEAKMVSTRYPSIEYEGSSVAKMVVVVFGEHTATWKDAVVQAQRHGCPVGALVLRVVWPWNAKALVAALPVTVNTIVVVETNATAKPWTAQMLASVQGRSINVLSTGSDSAWNTSLALSVLRQGLEWHFGQSKFLLPSSGSSVLISTPPVQISFISPNSLHIEEFVARIHLDPTQSLHVFHHDGHVHLQNASGTGVPTLVQHSTWIVLPPMMNNEAAISDTILKEIIQQCGTESTLIMTGDFSSRVELEEALPVALLNHIVQNGLRILTTVDDVYSAVGYVWQPALEWSGVSETSIRQWQWLSEDGRCYQHAVSTPVNQEWTVLIPDESAEKQKAIQSMHANAAAWQLMFPEAYASRTASLRLGAIATVCVTKWQRLTPLDYARNVFHVEMDLGKSGLKYELGQALAVYGVNAPSRVDAFLDDMGWDATQWVSYDSQTLTVFQLCSQMLDLFGPPGKKFLQGVEKHATREQETLINLIEKRDLFKEWMENSPTYAATFAEYIPHGALSLFMEMVPVIKARHYSIASSRKAYGNSVHLLVVIHDWTIPKNGETVIGQCSDYLSTLSLGDPVAVSLCHSILSLPKDPRKPIIMAGLGTGMAPFRAFLQERAALKARGVPIGPIALYFGSRHQHQEYLYGDELEEYVASGVLTRLQCAFSRDQPQKVYIQDKLQEDADLLAKWLVQEQGHFYLCGPTWPVPDVKAALLKAFGTLMPEDQVEAYLEKMKQEDRYVLEVY